MNIEERASLRHYLSAEFVSGGFSDKRDAHARVLEAFDRWFDPQQSTPTNSYHDAYRGARDEMYAWKKRALEAEETSRRLNRALAQEINGPTHMGEPVMPAVQQSAAMPDFVQYDFTNDFGDVGITPVPYGEYIRLSDVAAAWPKIDGSNGVDMQQRLAAVRRVLRGAVLIAECDGKDLQPQQSTPAVEQSAAMPELSAKQIRAGWEATFSVNNPFCPCDLKSFTKAVQWRERAALAKGSA